MLRIGGLTAPNCIANKGLVDLSAEDIDELLAIDKTLHFRGCHPDWTGYGSLGFPDCEEK